MSTRVLVVSSLAGALAFVAVLLLAFVLGIRPTGPEIVAVVLASGASALTRDVLR